MHMADWVESKIIDLYLDGEISVDRAADLLMGMWKAIWLAQTNH